MGDLARGRTVRSLAWLLTLFEGVKLYFVAPDSLQIGQDILDLLGIEISPARLKCALLSLETLQRALEARGDTEATAEAPEVSA